MPQRASFMSWRPAACAALSLLVVGLGPNPAAGLAAAVPRASSSAIAVPPASSSAFPAEVAAWLRGQGYHTRGGSAWQAGQRRPLLLVRGRSSLLVLHLLPTPRDAAAVLPALVSHDMSDRFAEQSARRPRRLVHLWEDQWSEHPRIVRSRLLASLGSSARVMARQTSARRIDAPTCDAFLVAHHLWGPTKARYRYGLEDRSGELVAVATFSPRWNRRRHGASRASHELIRYCSRRGVTVTGGISKLLAAFVRDASPDEIVTVIDRDWGSGTGWGTLGFRPLKRLPPVTFFVGPSGRCHPGSGPNPYRRRLPAELQEALDVSKSARADGVQAGARADATAARLLASRGFFAVHDAGAERHLLIVTPQEDEPIPVA